MYLVIDKENLMVYGLFETQEQATKYMGAFNKNLGIVYLADYVLDGVLEKYKNKK